MEAPRDAVGQLADYARVKRPGSTLGLYLFGSEVHGGAKPDSDIDLLLVTVDTLTRAERCELVMLLLEISGWKGHAPRHPECWTRRPLELTSVAVGADRPAHPTTRRDFQYGEWLRDSLVTGRIPGAADDPDTLPLIASALTAYRTLIGPPLEMLIAPVEPLTLRNALHALIPTIIGGIEGDERNALLTLARIVVTLECGQIVPKDVAADRIAPSLNPRDRALLDLAQDGYRGVKTDHWQDVATLDILAAAQGLSRRARAAG